MTHRKTPRRAALRIALVAAALFPLALASTDAGACLRAMNESDPAPSAPNPAAEIASAERLLDDGNNVLALTSVARVYPGIKAALPGDDPLENRGLRIAALALARENGAVAVGAFRATKSDERAANLQWSVTRLRALNAKRPNEPSLQADLGESLARVPAYRSEALRMLSALAAKDLMGSPQAYAALAKLRLAAGDAPGSAEAVRRCEGMTKNPAICRPSAPIVPGRAAVSV